MHTSIYANNTHHTKKITWHARRKVIVLPPTAPFEGTRWTESMEGRREDVNGGPKKCGLKWG